MTSTEFQAYASKLFDEIDADADGKLSGAEITASAMDENGEGELGFMEFEPGG